MKTFFWFFVTGLLNGVLIYIRERLKEEQHDDNQRVPGAPEGHSRNPPP